MLHLCDDEGCSDTKMSSLPRSLLGKMSCSCGLGSSRCLAGLSGSGTSTDRTDCNDLASIYRNALVAQIVYNPVHENKTRVAKWFANKATSTDHSWAPDDDQDDDSIHVPVSVTLLRQ